MRKIKEKESIYVPISFEYFLTALFGKLNYHGYVGSHTKETWKKDILKICKYLKRSIELNVISDNYHKNTLLTLCDMLVNNIRKSKTIEQINVTCIEILFRLAFCLLGTIPYHWNSKAPYTDKYWKLGGHRVLNYTQSEEQKVYLILYLVDIQRKYTVDKGDFDSLNSIFYRRFRANYAEFLKWFKKEYPEIYCDIF